MFKISCAIALLISSTVMAAELSGSPWAASAKSRARLITDGLGGAGFQVELAPGAVTYWRDPGESGVPPTFDFSGSINLARAEVDYPAPKRIREPDDSEAFGYARGVVFPIRVVPLDRSKPVTLSAKVNYAVCEKICLPARANVDLDIAQGAASSEAPALAAARATIPVAVTAAAAGLTVTPTSEKSWRLCVAPVPGDLFVESPPGYWIASKREGDGPCYALTLRLTPAGGAFPIEAHVTLTGATAAEVTVALNPK